MSSRSSIIISSRYNTITTKYIMTTTPTYKRMDYCWSFSSYNIWATTRNNIKTSYYSICTSTTYKRSTWLDIINPTITYFISVTTSNKRTSSLYYITLPTTNSWKTSGSSIWTTYRLNTWVYISRNIIFVRTLWSTTTTNSYSNIISCRFCNSSSYKINRFYICSNWSTIV